METQPFFDILNSVADIDTVRMVNTSQSSTETLWACATYGCAASKAIDGYTGFGSVTQNSYLPWWKAEFTETITIEKISIWIDGWAWRQGYYDHTWVETRNASYDTWETCKGDKFILYSSSFSFLSFVLNEPHLVAALYFCLHKRPA